MPENQVNVNENKSDAESRLMLLLENSSALLASPESPRVLERILQLAHQLLGADAYAVWRRQPSETREWRRIASMGLSETYELSTFEPTGQPVVLQLEPIAIEDIERTGPPAWKTRQEIYRQEGIKALLTVPVCIHGEIAGTIVYYYRAPHRFSALERRLAAALGNLAGGALGTAELYERERALRAEAEADQRRANFLAEAGRLLGSSLDFEKTLRNVAELAVPSFADWCSVEVLSRTGNIERLAVQHADAAKISLALDMIERYPPRPDSPSRQALTTGKAFLIAAIPEAVIDERAYNPEHAQLIRALGLRSLIIVPLIARDRVLGLVTFAMSESGRVYSEADFAVAQELAARASTAIEKAQLHQDLLEREQQLQTLADSIPQLAWMTQADGSIVWYNQRWYEYTGTTPESMLGWGWQSVHHPEYLPQVLARWRQSLSIGEAFEMEFPLRGADGIFRWFLTRSIPLRNAAGAVVRWFGTNTDVDELRRARAAEEQAAHVAKLLNRIGPLLSSELDTDRLAQKITDLATELVGAQFGSLFRNVENEQGESYLLYTLSGAPREAFAGFPMPRNTALFGATFRGETVIRCDDVTADPRYGKNAPYHGMPAGHLPVRSYLAAPVVSRFGQVLGGLFFGHSAPGMFSKSDEELVSGLAAQAAIALDNAQLFSHANEQRRRAEAALQALEQSNEDLRRANADLEQFAYSASHDLQEPVRLVALYTQLLERDYGHELDPAANAYMKQIVQNAWHIQNLLRDLLAYIGLTKNTEHTLLLADANAVLEATIHNLHALISASQARVTRDVLPSLPMHEVHLEQLFSNLLTNALKYRSPDHVPCIHISSKSSANECVVSVRDNGIGIDPKYAHQIFRIFKRLHSTEEYEGTGIGLAICQKVVERYGGRIWVESQLGQGATFFFAIPSEGRGGSI